MVLESGQLEIVFVDPRLGKQLDIFFTKEEIAECIKGSDELIGNQDGENDDVNVH